MRPLITALGICALLLAPAGAYAAGSFTWTGSASTAWANQANWTGGEALEYPGFDDTDDTATIDADPDSRQPIVSTGTPEIASLTIDSNTNAVAVNLDITGGTLTVNTSTTVDADADAANNATLKLAGGTFDPQTAFVLDGGQPDAANNGVALFDFDSGTLTNPDAMTFRGEATIDAEASFTVDGALTIEATTNAFETLATIDMGSSTLTAASAALSAGATAGYEAKCLLSAGTLDVNGEVDLTGATSVNSDATMEVTASATFLPESLDLNGHTNTSNDYGDAILVFNEDVSVQSDTGVDATGYGEVRVASGKVFDCWRLDVGDGAVYSELEMNTAAGLMIAEQLVVKGGDASGEKGLFKVNFSGAEFYTE
ncbi:MAG: hypothetical protein GY778_04655 [bacterium]|nr:hypothetical protein [bacterium]